MSSTLEPGRRAFAQYAADQAKRRKLLLQLAQRKEKARRARIMLNIEPPPTLQKSMRMPDKSIVRFRVRRRAKGQNSVFARRKGETVGGLHSDSGDGYIYGIGVVEAMRRKGIATGMYRHAQNRGIPLQHSQARTADGEAWARSLGERLPPNAYPGYFGS
jgi:ribosomal protein S18 acetylase RimI-like enzyme